MRKSLFTAAAAAPLLLLAGAPAMAETVISDARTTAVSTATINNGQPDDLTITGGSVKLTSGTAVTLNSNNAVKANGTVSVTDADNGVGVLIEGGRTGSFSNGGTVSVVEDYTAKDTNNDGVVDGPFAKGAGRYGVRVTGAAPFVGSVTNASGGSIQVEGNNSYGVSVETGVQGDVVNDGAISLVGDNGAGLRITGPVSGRVKTAGAISVTGGGSVGAEVSGNVGGALTVYGSIVNTGYRVTTRSNDPAINASLLPENLLQSGSALSIRGDVAGGVFIAAPPTGTVSTDTTTDADKDGVVDSLEGAGQISTFGSAPAVAIGAAARDVHLGAFGTGDNAYGLIVRGTATGDGVFDNNGGEALRIGTGDGTVHIDGGLRVVGTLTGKGREADGVAVHLKSGAVVPQLRNEGVIAAQSISAKASSANAILIDAGGSATSLTNSGTISAGLTGNLGSAYAVRDLSGTLSSVTNSNTIIAAVQAASTVDTALGRKVALDLSANTSGVSILQTANASTTITPTISGDILLGSGNDTVDLRAGNVIGALGFGAGSGSISIDGGATYLGAMTSSGVLSVNVKNGTLADLSPTTIQASSLNVGDKGVLVVSADPVNGKATLFNVSGPANIAAGGKLGLHLESLPTAAQSYTVISASSLTVGTSADNLTAAAPYLFVAGFSADQTAGTVNLNLRRRTAAEAGLNRSETAAYDAVYAGLNKDLGIQNAFLAQNDKAGLAGVLDQTLPDHAGGVFRLLSWAAEAHGVATGDAPLGQDQAGPTRAWTNEIVLHETKDAGDAPGYNVLGFGMVGGVESVSSRGDALGARIGFTAGNIRQPDLAGDNLLGVSQLSTGVYWRGSFGGLRADAQLGAGYVWMNGRREFLYSDTTLGAVHRTASAKWSGYTLSARAGLAYRADLGAAFIEPRVHLDYFRMHESGYTEDGGGDGFDLKVGGRSGDLLSATGSLTAGLEWGTGFRWRPQVEVGYRSVLSGSAGDTTASLTGSGVPFTLAAESLTKGAAIGRVGIRVYSDYLDLLLDAGGQFADDYTDIDVHLTARTIF